MKVRFLFLFYILFYALQPLAAQVYEFTAGQKWVDSVFKTLTREERIGQLIMASAYSSGAEKNTQEIRKLIKDQKIGGVIFFKGTVEAQAAMTNDFQKRSKLPLLIAIDGEWGVGMRLDDMLKFPRQMSLGALENDSLIYYMGREVAHQCKTLGIHINFAPVADINNNAENPVINDRSFGDDKYDVATKSMLYMKGMQDNGVMACLKHFPGHGDTKTDSHLDLPVINYPMARLDTLELYPFRQLVKQGAMSVMVAHLQVPAIDSTPHTPVSLSKKLVTGILKDSMGFKGLVFTDALNMKGVAAYYSQPEAAIKALQAGNDVLLCLNHIPQVVSKVKLALDSNLIDTNAFNQSVKKVLAAKYAMGLTKTPKVSIKNIKKVIQPSSAYWLREQMAEQQITVLKNTKKTLPIKNAEKKKIASIAIGENFKTPFQVMLGNMARMDYYQYDRSADAAKFEWVLGMLEANEYDLVIVSIHNTNRSPEKLYGISQASIDFINRLNKEEKLVLVSFGIPYNLNFFPGMKNLVVAYQDTEINQEKAAQLLFGVISNQATLPVNVTEEYHKRMGVKTEQVKRINYTIPEAVGSNSNDFTRLDNIVNTAIKQKALPGAQLLVMKDGNVIYNKGYGYMTYEKKKPITTDMLYDIASMSKIMGTTLAVMKLYEEGHIGLDKPASRYIKELKKSNKKDITIRQLLTHTAGLKSWIPFYKSTLNDTALYCKIDTGRFTIQVADSFFMRSDYKDSIWKQIVESDVTAPGKYVYSDIGFFILQRLVEEITGEGLDAYMEEYFYRPLALGTMTYNPLKKFDVNRVVPTEDDREFRRQLVCGYVHDPAAAMMGGVAGNAGIFSNASDVAVVMQMLLNNGEYNGKRYFKKETVELFTAKQLDECRRGLGFDKPEPDKAKGNPTADVVPCSAFGHSGFTGTIVWADPENQLVFVFLSNRVYPSAENNLITKNNVRTNLHQAIYEIVLGKK